MRKPAFAPKRKRPGLSTRPFKNATILDQLSENYPAFFSGAPAAFFFSIARFNSSARGDSSVAFAFSRNASRPPRWSTLLIALVDTRRRTLRPSALEMKVTLHRFGRNRRLVLMLE